MAESQYKIGDQVRFDIHHAASHYLVYVMAVDDMYLEPMIDDDTDTDEMAHFMECWNLSCISDILAKGKTHLTGTIVDVSFENVYADEFDYAVDFGENIKEVSGIHPKSLKIVKNKS